MAYPIVHDYTLPTKIRDDLVNGIDLVRKYPYQTNKLISSLSDYTETASSQLLVTAGINGALDLLAQSLLVGRRVVVPTPAFWQLSEAPLRYGATVITCDLFNTDEIISAFKHANAILLSHPNNPLGIPLDFELLQKLCNVAEDRLIIIDESYVDISCKSFVSAKLSKNIIVLRGFKAFLIPGSRVGYIIGNEKIIEHLAWRLVPFGITVQAEVAALSVLKNIGAIHEIWRCVMQNKKDLEAALRSLGGECTTSTTLFACWRHPNARNIGPKLFTKGVATMFPGKETIVGMPHDCIRLTARVPEVQSLAIERLRNTIDELKRAVNAR